MQIIYIITTGGAITREYSEQLELVLNRENGISTYLKQLHLPDSEIHAVTLMNKDSLEMTAEDRASLVAEIKELVPLRFPIIITHGTDTIVDSGAFIEREVPELTVPIILTGAVTPVGFYGSDGLQNLTESLFAARILGPGVHLVIHGRVFPVTKARKDRWRGTFVRWEADQECVKLTEKT